ncbi:MAG: hypothetical protein R3C43_11665 [Chloroflexota bacterium]
MFSRLHRGSLCVIIGLLLLSLMACGSTQSEPDTCDDLPDILFFDDFNGEMDCGWTTYNRGGGIAAIQNSAMQLKVSQPGEIWWTNPLRTFDDVVIRVEARQVAGANDNAYGVICRYQNEDNFYVFLISGDGYYAIGKYQTGVDNVTYLTENSQFQLSEAINTGVASNELQVSCIGNQLSLEVNGASVVTVTDPTFVTGDIGLAASTLQATAGTFEFDNVQVTPP